MFRQQTGSAMITTVIVTVVLIFSGFALWNYSMSEIKHSEREVSRMKAHYLARSGAESVAEHILGEKEGSIISVMTVGQTTVSEPTLLGDGFFTVSVTCNTVNEFLVASTGVVSDVEDTISVLISRKVEGFDEIFNRAIFSTGILNISHTNANVFGDVESNQGIIGVPNVGSKYEYSDRVFTEATFPSIADLETLSNISNSNVENHIYMSTYPDKDGVYIENVDINSQGKLVFHIEEGDNFVFLVDQYSNKGTTEIEGGGVLLMFVTHSCIMKTPHASSAESLLIFMDDNTVFTLIAGGHFNGYLYGPNATTIIQSKPSTVRGSIITGGLYGNIAEARFIGTVEHQVRDSLDLSTLGSYFPQSYKYEISRWSN